MIIIGILSVTILLPVITTEFLTLAPTNAFGQQLTFDTETGTNESTAAPSNNITEPIPMITVVDVINSTYIVPKEIDSETEGRIERAVRDKINDVLHTIVIPNATIISSPTVTNDFVSESITVNNNVSRFLEVLPDQIEIALERIRSISQPANPMLELHADFESVCIVNSTSLADCDINIRIH
jgi:hypothetical protein